MTNTVLITGASQGIGKAFHSPLLKNLKMWRLPFGKQYQNSDQM